MPQLQCHKCKTAFDFATNVGVGRRDECAKCRSDLRVCRNCRHYDATARWECRESIAEVVLEKEKANFCDFFQPREGTDGASTGPSSVDLKALAESLFKKS